MRRACAGLLLLCLVSPLFLVRAATLSGKALVIGKDYFSTGPIRERYVKVGTGTNAVLVKVEGAAAKRLRTGMTVNLKGRSIAGADGSQGHFAADTVEIKAQPGRLGRGTSGLQGDAQYQAKPQRGLLQGGLPTEQMPVLRSDVITLFLPLSFEGCTKAAGGTYSKPWYTQADVEDLVFTGGSTGISLASLYSNCSYGQTTMSRATSRVAPVTKLACSGTSVYGNAYSAAGACSFADFQGWAEAALTAAAASGIAVNTYFYKLIIVPEGTSCGWAGLAYIGCDGSFSCNSWVDARYLMGRTASAATNAQVAFHEQGHNLYLNHAASYDNTGAIVEYGDWSCAMGYCCANRCYNTPHAWQQGWLSMQVLDGGLLTAAATVTATFAAQTVARSSGLKVKISSWAAADNIYLGYRLAEGGDAALSSIYSNKVNVYTFPGVGTGSDSESLSFWLGAFGAGQSFSHAKAPGLVFKCLTLSGGQATVTVCRKSASGVETLQTCAAGLDGDCDGLKGVADPDCASFLAPPPRCPQATAITSTAKPSAASPFSSTQPSARAANTSSTRAPFTPSAGAFTSLPATALSATQPRASFPSAAQPAPLPRTPLAASP
ncbi:Autolysin [Chlorella vulgaris]